jgi:dTDP-N-acetylfucosamine:lipid II N-acetylfucosaminyltransferase
VKYLHLFAPDDDQKFAVPFYEFIKDKFDNREHFFFIPQHANESLRLHNDNVEYFEYGFVWAIRFFVRSFFCEKIIVHKIPHNIYFLLLFSIFPRLARKSVWIIWGGDLYYHKLRTKSIKTSFIEVFRKMIIRRFNGLASALEGDYNLAKKWYNVSGPFIYTFAYPSNLFKSLDLNYSQKDNRISIQIGNSACSTNNHLQLLDSLKFLREERILLYCPLSYSGEQNYITEVIQKGFEIFGKEKFIPMLEFMPHDEYIEFLSRIDVAILNHDRQRGLGNITSLLSLGKKIYIKESITTWEFCVKQNIRVFSVNTDLQDVLVPLPESVKEHNLRLVRSLFSEDRLISQLAEVFES